MHERRRNLAGPAVPPARKGDPTELDIGTDKAVTAPASTAAPAAPGAAPAAPPPPKPVALADVSELANSVIQSHFQSLPTPFQHHSQFAIQLGLANPAQQPQREVHPAIKLDTSRAGHPAPQPQGRIQGRGDAGFARDE